MVLIMDWFYLDHDRIPRPETRGGLHAFIQDAFQ
jgi:hypothetical protein